jgi:hypothetical protein
MRASADQLARRTLLSVVIVLSTIAAASAQSATTTSLNVSPSNNVSTGAIVTLTATVTAGTSAVTAGQVLFCNANATYCEDSAVLASVWITKSGTATLIKPFGLGTYNVQAVFKGTSAYATSTSNTQTITVTTSTPLATTTTLGATGGSGSYNLTATVTTNNPVAPTGTVSFIDSTNGNLVLATDALGTSTAMSSYSMAPCSSSSASCPLAATQNQSVAAGDFNNDGNLDYVIASVGSGTVTIMLGNGDGTFTQGQTYPVGSYPDDVVVADLNGDGNLDIAVAASSGTGVTVLLGNGDGTFTTAASPSVSFAAAIAVGDFNGDGIPDLAVSNSANGYVVSIFLGNGDGTFAAGANISVPSWSVTPEGLVAADFNSDGKTDLAVTSSNNYAPSSYQVTILLGNGDGTFNVGQSYTTGSDDIAIAVGDFNGDGVPDLAVADRYDATVTVLLGPLDTTTSPVVNTLLTGHGPFAIVTGDFNGDGKEDIATANYDDGTLTLLLGNGDGTFNNSSVTPNAGAAPDGLVTGDFNGDGLLDFVTANYQSTTASILLQSMTTTATAVTGTVSVPDADLVYASYTGDSNYAASQSSPAATSSLPPPTAASIAQTITFPNPGPQTYGATVTLTATASSGLPVTYWIVSGPGELSAASGVYTLSFTAAGNVVVEADQAGNASYLPATPVRVAVAVSGITTQTSSSTVVTAGQIATIPVVLNSVNGFAGNISFNCSVPANMTGASCSANPVQIASGGTATANVLLQTSASSSAAMRAKPWNALPSGIIFGAVIIAGVGRRRRSRKVLVAGSLVILTVVLMGIVSCGGGSGSGGSQGAGGTPAGTYNLTLVATSNKATYNITVPVTVK